VRALGGWAYGAIYRDSPERNAALASWLDFYNHRRPHGALSHKSAMPAYTSGTTSSGLTPSSPSLVSESIIDES
jgi:transposase InsO family protein